MTSSDQQNIERKLNHVLDMGKMIIDQYPHITCTERAALLLAMTAAVRQVAANLDTAAALLRKHLLDPFHINYTNYAQTIEHLQKLWAEELKGAPIFHNLDNHSRPLTSPIDIAQKEDTDYGLDFPAQAASGLDLQEARVGLMESAAVMCAEIEKGFGQISRTLRGIVADYHRLRRDTQQQEACLNVLQQQYEAAMWAEDKARFVEEVEEYTFINRDKSATTYEHYLRRMTRDATDPHYIKVLAELNECYLAGERAAAFIVEHRDKLTLKDLASHFCFVKCRRLLCRHIEGMALAEPADEAYKDLFVSRAAQEVCFLLAHTIGQYVDFRHNYQYAALQMAMQDTGLIYTDRNNGVQMKDYINKAFLATEDQIKDQTTLTQWTGKLLGSMFGTMDEQHLQGNYSRKDFEKMKQHYWRCLSIINKVVQLDLQQLQFAPYLYAEHKQTPHLKDYCDSEGHATAERLADLKSVINGDKLFH